MMSGKKRTIFRGEREKERERGRGERGGEGVEGFIARPQ